MGYSPSALENSGQILSEFNGATTISLGDIVLPVQADLTTLNVRFSIVEDLSPYNAIMGQSWFHKMKIISSNYHQMISYLIESRQMDLQGRQLHPIVLSNGIGVQAH